MTALSPNQSSSPSHAEIDDIIAMEDIALRNLRITQTYHELTLALGDVLGFNDVSWCAYATWASKTAGVFIRGDKLEETIHRYLNSSPKVAEDLSQLRNVLKWLGQSTDLDELVLLQVLLTVTGGIERDIGHGNQIVFAELAPIYRNFLDLLVESATYDEAALERLLDTLTPGPVGEGGQDLLRQAFASLYQANFESDPKAKAEQIFLSNVLVGLHEQTRLQGPIEKAMQAPLTAEVEQVLKERLDAWMRLHVLRPFGSLVQMIWRRRLRQLAVQLTDDWRRISTDMLMSMTLPSETLYLGRDVPPTPDGRMFPSELETITNPDLLDVLSGLDQSVNSTVGSGAEDWSNLGDRMNFIADFFRSRQQDDTLFPPPFNE